MEKIKNLIKLMRPNQWFKSFFIVFGSIPAIFLMPVRFDLILLFLLAGISNMILLQGVMYITNDIADAKKDRMHPKKRIDQFHAVKYLLEKLLCLDYYFFV